MDADVLLRFEQDKEVVLEEYLRSGQALDVIVNELRDEFKQSLNQSHDFLQLIKLIQGHVKTILEERFPGDPPEVAADKLDSEGAIYFSTELMIGKIDATLFLEQPNLAFGNERTIELHRFVTKYYRIYRSYAQQKHVDLRTTGASYGRVRYNSAAIGAVVHALLDNLVKYAPPGSKADILFVEDLDSIRVEFASLGPRIKDMEYQRIFLPGYRGIQARQEAGLGFGLAAARRISDALDLELTVRQSPTQDSSFRGSYLTTFGLSFTRIS
ncbi:MAG TPA: ATP-binding protein [Mycobacteriales bacterium]|nr:ATP-binding protein [Mycobacteriales bacterium]